MVQFKRNQLEGADGGNHSTTGILFKFGRSNNYCRCIPLVGHVKIVFPSTFISRIIAVVPVGTSITAGLPCETGRVHCSSSSPLTMSFSIRPFTVTMATSAAVVFLVKARVIFFACLKKANAYASHRAFLVVFGWFNDIVQRTTTTFITTCSPCVSSSEELRWSCH